MNALVSARALQACTLLAVDGGIGRIEQFYFDERHWAIRYLVVDTGKLPASQRLLISPVAVGAVRPHERVIHIELTGREVRNSPPLDTRRPVSRSYERRYFDYYGWPPYWRSALRRTAGSALAGTVEPAQASLHGSAGFIGCELAARDDPIGRVADFIIDTRYWVIRYLRIDTIGWRPGGEVLISPAWIERVGWAERRA